MTWVEWFPLWLASCRRFESAYRDGSQGTVLGHIIMEQKNLLAQIPPPINEMKVHRCALPYDGMKA